MLSVRLLVNSRQLVVKFWQSLKLYADFQLHWESAPPIPALFKDQLYTHLSIHKCIKIKEARTGRTVRLRATTPNSPEDGGGQPRQTHLMEPATFQSHRRYKGIDTYFTVTSG